MSRSKLLMTVVGRLLAGVLMFALLFFLPAGTWRYWQAWMYIGVLITPMFFVIAYFMKKDPDLLERRMRMRERRIEQRMIINLSVLFFILSCPALTSALAGRRCPPGSPLSRPW
jgi:hypothetical protein